MLEDGRLLTVERGTPQGAVISPVLANIYLHYVYDLWVQHWRRQNDIGEVIVVRYADDTVVGFQHRSDAERLLDELRQRLKKFGLELHPQKTRIIEFGRFAARNRKARGLGKPETFAFLAHGIGPVRSAIEPKRKRADQIPQEAGTEDRSQCATLKVQSPARSGATYPRSPLPR